MQLQALDQPGNLSTWAADINAAHADAMKHASSAIDYAKTAGNLLLKAKQKLQHGAFGGWLEANCSVSERQARRYMAAAQGKPLPMRALKSDTVSVLPAIANHRKDDAKDLAEANKELSRVYEINSSLEYAVLMASVRKLPASERADAYETIETHRALSAELQTLTKQRDAAINENSGLKRTLAQGRREIDRLKKAA